WEGELTSSDTLLSPAQARQLMNLNKLDSMTSLIVYTQSKEDSLKYTIRYRNVNISGIRKRINSEQYSLRYTQLNPGKTIAVPINTSIPMLVYSLPYVDPAQPNVQKYCELTSEGVPPEKWWEKYKVQHFIIFEFTFVTEAKE